MPAAVMPAAATLSPAEESALLERVRAGDREALEALLARVAPSIYRFGLRMCRNVHDAEDVLQDALVEVAGHVRDFEGRSSLSSWVFAVTRSACARKRRGLKNQAFASVSDDARPEEIDPAPSPEARTAERELGATLARALDALPDDYREVIALRDVEGLSAPEAAAALGISVDALKSRLHRAREALRTALRPALEEAAAPVPAGCPDVSTLWSRKLEGELGTDDCSAMEAHLAGCPSCGAACDALKRALLACQHVGAEPVPAEVQDRVRAAVRALVSARSP